MENGEFSNIYENTENARFYEIPNLEDGEGEPLYNQISEDLESPSFTAMLDSMDMRCQESPENSLTNSLSSQYGYDGGEETDSSQQDVPEGMQLLSPRQVDKSIEEMTFGNQLSSSTDFSLKKIQGTSKNFQTTMRFPCDNNSEENNFQKEDHRIFLIVKILVPFVMSTGMVCYCFPFCC